MPGIDETEVSRLLEGAARLAAKVRNCWLVTASGSAANARPMGRVPPDPQLNDWKVLFLTDGRSRKAAEIKSAASVELIYQNDREEAFATLAGRAKLIEDPVEVAKLWKSGYEVYFATAEDRANAAFIEIAINQMELWIRGVTPDPFGLRPTVIEREAGGAWRMKAPLS
jgi:general stress protein 26